MGTRTSKSWTGGRTLILFSLSLKLVRIASSNPGVRLGGAPVQDPEDAMNEAIELAKEADVVIAVVGLNGDWETEGYDRTTLALPGRTDELVSRVAKANPNTIVVTQSVSLSFPISL